ncbi:EspA/EspE family type VII secretion system effector [Mycobacterium sp. 050134]|uniref:EspA/EspE family type VII secretion system effector n=1 Tax=Mycobacterium sp. 050134 TaxID=3096111 RepID=UPI002EDA83E7
MQPPIQAAMIILNLGALGSQFVGLDDGGFADGEYLSSTTMSTNADGLAALGAFVSPEIQTKIVASKTGLGFIDDDYFQDEKKSSATAASAILWAISIADVLESTTGFGPPAEGAGVRAGSRELSALIDMLQAALPDDRWQGAAAQVYAEACEALQQCARKMAQLDAELTAVVTNHADWVTHIRLGFGLLKGLLVAAIAVELALLAWVPLPANFTAARAFGWLVAVLGVTVAVGLVTTLFGLSFRHAAEADDLGNQYADLTACARMALAIPADATTPAVVSQQSSVSNFEELPTVVAPAFVPTAAPATVGVTGSAGLRSIAAPRLVSWGASGEVNRGQADLTYLDTKSRSFARARAAAGINAAAHSGSGSRADKPVTASAVSAPTPASAADADDQQHTIQEEARAGLRSAQRHATLPGGRRATSREGIPL